MAEITDPLILPADVHLVPVASLPENIQKRLESEPGDVAIQKKHSRTPSKILNEQMAVLVEQFRSASTIVEAILAYSGKSQADPNQVLDNSFPLIQQLIVEGLLVPAGSEEAKQFEISLERGDQLDDFTIVTHVHAVEDVEIYQARRGDGVFAAIKILRPRGSTLGPVMIHHESEILNLLDGDTAPRLLAKGVHQGRPYLALEWLEGLPVDQYAAELRSGEPAAGRAEILDLCIEIVDAFTRLHCRGFVHGDIHPNNVILDRSGKARLLDFGLSASYDPAHPLPAPYRGGVAFFYEPEFAPSLRKEGEPPAVSFSGEQYSLAVLLYSLVTGRQYLDFALERAEMLRQIAEDPPLTFKEQGFAEWPALEQILFRALRKDPAQRYPDLNALAADLRSAAGALRLNAGADTLLSPEHQQAAQQQRKGAEDFLSSVLGRVQWGGDLFNAGIVKSPTASVNAGAAGVAYALYRMALNRGDANLLALADVWSSRAMKEVGNDAAFYNAEIEQTPENVGRISPYHTSSGVYAVQSLIAQAMGNRALQEAALVGFVQEASQPCEELDVTLGLSGRLVVGALLYESLADKPRAERAGLLALGNDTLERIWSEIDTYPPISEAAQLPNLGIAHGWGGILYAALRWCSATGASLPAAFHERLRQLAGCAEPHARGARWPWQLDQPGLYMPGWCNGSAGQVFLWTLAAKKFNDPALWETAEKAAWNCWEDPAEIGSLCCGLAGRAYALLNWWKADRRPIWLERARILAYQAARSIREIPQEDMLGYEHSLYKGEVGVACLISELETPEWSSMPFFEPEGWPDPQANNRS